MRKKRRKPCKTMIPTSQPLQESSLISQPASQDIKSQKSRVNLSRTEVEVRNTQAGWGCSSPALTAHPAGADIAACPQRAPREISWAELMLIKKQCQSRNNSQHEQDSCATPESPPTPPRQDPFPRCGSSPSHSP